jgi:hypothetical protein
LEKEGGKKFKIGKDTSEKSKHTGNYYQPSGSFGFYAAFDF